MSPTPTDTARHFDDTLHAYRRAQVLMTCGQFDVFETIGGGAATAAEVAERAGVPAGRLARLMDAAVALDYLERDGDRYRNSGLSLTHLADPEASTYLGTRLRSEQESYRSWGQLADAVRGEDGVAPPCESRVLSSPTQRSLRAIARNSSEAVTTAFGPLLPEGPATALDLGGGHGTYSAILAEAFPRLTATVLDRDPALATIVAEESSARGVADRVGFATGDFVTDDLGPDGSLDLAMAFMSIGGLAPDELHSLFAKVHDVLRPGGWFVLRGFYWRDEITTTLFDLHALLHHGDASGAHRREQIEQVFAATGFDEIQTLPAPAPEAGTLLAGRRPVA